MPDFDELERKLAEGMIRETYWGGRRLPFPVFFDATGATLAAFEIQRFPTTLLIDPAGRFRGTFTGVAALERALAGQLEASR